MFIGLDVGTSGTKAGVFGADGHPVKSHQVSYGFCNTDGGCRELDPAAVWDAVLACLKGAGSGYPVRTITVSSLGEAVIPIDREGNPLGNSITGTDIRGNAELDGICAAAGAEKLTDITGLNLSAIYSANKILWYRKNRPDIYEKAWKFVTFQDYIIYRLCRRAVIDYSMASRTLLFDIRSNQWSEYILDKLKLDKDKLSGPVRGGSVVGSVLDGIKRETGLIGEIKVVAGTHDHICNAIGCGAVHEGDCADTVGTTEGLTAILESSRLSPESISRYQISCEPFAADGMFNTVAWSNTSGVLLKWFVEEFVREEKGRDLREIYKELNGGMKSGATGLLILPHFSGAATPYMDPASKGVIMGLTLQTKREDIYKALMEAANLELWLILGCLRQAGLEVKKLIATGGALSEKLLQIKADILGIPVHTAARKQTGTLGGAVLGAVAMKEYDSIPQAVSHMVEEGPVFFPDSKMHDIYREKAGLYEGLYRSAADINHHIKTEG